MLEYDGEVEVEVGGEVARLNAQGRQLTLTVPSDRMLLALIGLYCRFPVSKATSRAPFIFDNHHLLICVPHGGSLSVTKRQSWLRVYLPYKFSLTGVSWWFRHGPRFLYQFWRS